MSRDLRSLDVKPSAAEAGFSDGGDDDACVGRHRPIHRHQDLTGLFQVDDLPEKALRFQAPIGDHGEHCRIVTSGHAMRAEYLHLVGDNEVPRERRALVFAEHQTDLNVTSSSAKAADSAGRGRCGSKRVD